MTYKIRSSPQHCCGFLLVQVYNRLQVILAAIFMHVKIVTQYNLVKVDLFCTCALLINKTLRLSNVWKSLFVNVNDKSVEILNVKIQTTFCIIIVCNVVQQYPYRCQRCTTFYYYLNMFNFIRYRLITFNNNTMLSTGIISLSNVEQLFLFKIHLFVISTIFTLSKTGMIRVYTALKQVQFHVPTFCEQLLQRLAAVGKVALSGWWREFAAWPVDEAEA